MGWGGEVTAMTKIPGAGTISKGLGFAQQCDGFFTHH
jgi:hypothetical protein